MTDVLALATAAAVQEIIEVLEREMYGTAEELRAELEGTCPRPPEGQMRSDLPDVVRDMEWRSRAACGSYDDPDLWFARGSVKARQICEGCPVRRECLDFALFFEERATTPPAGIWGGMTPAERRREVARRRSAA